MKADFSGWASKAGLLCSDGRVIQHGAFKEKDQKKIPLVWSHRHDEPENVLGHALVEDRAEGVYIHGFFNDSAKAQTAKMAVQHGDLDSLSIYANRLKHQGNVVIHGNLVEVSLVLAGANPGAFIETIAHADEDGNIVDLEDTAKIWTPPEIAQLRHSDEEDDEDLDDEEEEDEDDADEDQDDEDFEDDEDEDEEEDDEDADDADSSSDADVVHSMTARQQKAVFSLVDKALKHDDGSASSAGGPTVATDEDRTIEDIFNEMSEEQQTVVQYLVQLAEDKAGSSTDNGDTAEHSALSHQEGSTMNVFDQTQNGGTAVVDKKKLSHSEIQTILEDAKRPGFTLESSVLAHADEYGITNIDLLFPDAKTVGDMPNVNSRQADWVPKVLDAVNQRPFAKVKSIVADLTEDEARAKGYIKGNLKKDEVISLLKRETGPTTVYKKQRLDRDDIIDITDFDVVAWLKWEIRFMLNEELARAILVGDGRPTNSEDKIKDPAGQVDGLGIRSIANESDLYAVKIDIPVDAKADEIMDHVAYAQEDYRGSGNPTLFTTVRNLTQLLLQKDKVGRRLYGTEQELASALRVKEIVAVPIIEEAEGVYGLIVNLQDYSVGTNQGGGLTFFEDFDIDFNQNKYLLETRLSGALTKPFSAIVLRKPRGTAATPTAPGFNTATNEVTIPAVDGIEYYVGSEVKAPGKFTITKDTEVRARAKSGYYIPTTATKSWTFTYTA